MPFTVDPNVEYAKMGAKAPEPEKFQDLENLPSGMPQGEAIPEGKVISQRVGRGQAPDMMVVPPREQGGPPEPAMAVVPPSGASRTTIGTFVEPTTSTNPLTAPPPAIPSGITDIPVVEEPKKEPRKPKLDLTQAILDHMYELGGEKSEKCQKFYGRSDKSIQNYLRSPGSIPLELVLRFLARKPELVIQIEEDLEPHFAGNREEGWAQSLPNRGKASVVVCSPVLERPTLPFLWALVYLAKKYELGFDIQSDTMIARSRNMLAKRFLESNAHWSLWIDGDMVVPIKNKDWFKWLTGTNQIPDAATDYDVLSRLESHQKPIVGAVYSSRKFRGSLVIQPEIRPRGPEDKTLTNEIRRGTATGLHEVGWIGFGCALVHRSVFLEVQHRFPNLAPDHEFAPWRFFTPAVEDGDIGEDEAFCRRVRACGIPIWLDVNLVCGHIGNMCFLPEHSAAIPTM
jgi:hypothetical protein